MPDAPSPETFVVRFLTPAGGTAGLGVLVGSRHVITCAHVVNKALGHDQREQSRPGGQVSVEFPLLPGQDVPPSRLHGTVAIWRPPPSTDGRGGDDIAGVLLDCAPPDGAAAASLSAEPARRRLQVSVFGYPETPQRPDGAWVSAIVRGPIANGRMQVDSAQDAALRIQPGFSGSPVCEDETERVVGMLSAAPRATASERDNHAISADRMRNAWQDILTSHWQLNAARRWKGESAELTVLHVSGPRFTGGKGRSAHTPEQPFFDRMHDDLARLADRHGIRPDLLVVTGDLADRGRPSEFRQAARFLNALAEAAGIPRRHVAVVPGNHDINRQACAAYFAEAEAGETQPVAPFWRKWQYYAAAFDEFYGGPSTRTFTPDEPFTLFEMPDLNVVVAGLNSTIADSHRESDHYGYLGEAQLGWFRAKLAEYQQSGWLRVAAVHHGAPRGSGDMYEVLGGPGLAHLFMYDGVPGGSPGGAPRSRHSGVVALPTGGLRYQLVTVRPDSITRHARRYVTEQGRWGGDSGIGPGGTDHHGLAPGQLTDAHKVFPSTVSPDESGSALPVVGNGESVSPQTGAARRHEFLDRVAEATEVRFPDAAVTARPEENYLRVCVPRDEGGTEQWPVGVIDGPPSGETVDAFADGIHARFASAGPVPRSELVHSALATPPQLRERARQRGIRLKSMHEYQELLDLTRLTEAQRERLATDRAYPAEMYVEQRYRIVHSTDQGLDIQTGLVAQAVDWLESEHARLVMVLGDFGRGKTAFLRQLTRVLPRLPGVTPVLVELRSLEKGPTLIDLLGQHLLRQGIEDVSPAKLRYMVNSGRVALLFDGFDELELRVGYESAAAYLRTLISSVSAAGQAKVILTSRTQHFRSADQVRTALGQQVESRAASRVVVLEEFSDGQMTDFLTRLYDGDEARALERLDLVRHIGNLLDLAHNPRMLSFIARLDSGRLRAAADGSGQVNAAGLYEQIIGSWLETEADRQRHVHGRPTFTREERFAACTELALRLWQSPDPQLAMADLSEAVTATLSDLTERGFTEEQAAHAIASGSLLVRTEGGAFTFIHQSVMEWLVAKAAAGNREILSRGLLSRLMAAFIIDLDDEGTVASWARRVLADLSAPDAARTNAYILTGRSPADAHEPGRIRLSGLDLRGRDLSGQNLANADLRGADLRGIRLDGVDLTGADLGNADLTGVTMTRGSLRDTTLTGSTWDRAAIINTDGIPEAAPELAGAAMPGRDPVEAMFVPPGECHDVVFSPDGTLLAVARGHTVQLVDTASDTTVRVLPGHTRQVTSVAFSPDGALLATASRDGTARVWDSCSGSVRATLPGHNGWVTAVTFSPDSRLVATASRDDTARTWDSGSGAARSTFTGHTGPVNAVAFSPDGSVLATASSDATARTWNADDGAPLHVFTGHGRAVTSVAFSPDGTQLATGSEDRTARTWDAATGTVRATITDYPEAVSSVAFSSDGTLLATAHGTRVETRDPASGSHRASFRERSPLTRVAFSPDDTTLAAVSTDRVHIWDLESGAQRITGTRSAAPVTSVAFSPDGHLLAVTDSAGAARTWDIRTGERRAIFSTPRSQTVTTVAVSPDGSLLATASPDGIVRRWEIATRTQSPKLLGGSPAAVAFSFQGTRIAAASLDGAVQSWNVDGTAGLSRGRLYPATAMAFASDGSFLATATTGGDSFVYQVSDWSTAARAVTHTASAEQVSAVAVSGDGTLLAVAMPDGAVRIWNTKADRQITTLTGHALPVSSVAFSPDAVMVITGSADGTARIWDAATGHERAVCTGHSDQVRAVAFSPNGTLTATGASDGTARIWDSMSGNPVATLIALPGGGYATLLPGGGYKLSEDTDDIWWAVKLRRFGPGELDPYVPGLRRLDPGEEIR